MTVASRARGTVTFADADTAFGLLHALDDDDEDVREVVSGQVRQDGTSLIVDIDASFTNADNLTFQIWLEEVAEAAIEGHLDTWQEDFGDSAYVRLHAGGEEVEHPGPFPGS